jgi:hypothetical protein
MKKIIMSTLLGVAIAIVPALVGASVSLGDLTLTAVKCRIFTPNGDTYNDKARFEFDNPQLLPVSGTVYDLSGARVTDLQPSASNPEEVLLWDGKDDNGQVVAGGIYVYQITFQGKHATGTVVVAR